MPPAPQPLHLLIASATASGEDAALDALLARMKLVDTVEADDACPATPFEIALARAHRLPGAPGCVPWAAFESGTAGAPCAWLHPCHWQLGLDRVMLANPAALELTDDQSRALLAAAQPLLAGDGVTLTYQQPDAWLAQGELWRGLTTWSMQRALHQPLTRGVLAQALDAAQGARLRRLQTELEMLLHNHPVNAARQEQGRDPINALWIDGAGALDAPHAPSPHVRTAQTAGVAGVDASLNELRRALDAGGHARLTLCGPRRALTFAPAHGLGAKITNFFRPQRLHDLRKQL